MIASTPFLHDFLPTRAWFLPVPQCSIGIFVAHGWIFSPATLLHIFYIPMEIPSLSFIDDMPSVVHFSLFPPWSLLVQLAVVDWGLDLWAMMFSFHGLSIGISLGLCIWCYPSLLQHNDMNIVQFNGVNSLKYLEPQFPWQTSGLQ